MSPPQEQAYALPLIYAAAAQPALALHHAGTSPPLRVVPLLLLLLALAPTKTAVCLAELQTRLLLLDRVLERALERVLELVLELVRALAHSPSPLPSSPRAAQCADAR